MSLVAKVTKWVIKEANGRVIIYALLFLNLKAHPIYIQYLKIIYSRPRGMKSQSHNGWDWKGPLKII